MTRDFFINALIESAKRYKKDEVYLSGLKKDIEYYVSENEKVVLPQADVIKAVCDNCKGDLKNKNGYILCTDEKCGTVYEQTVL